MEPSAREVRTFLDMHEKRDNERFEENKLAMKEALDDVSTAIHLSSRELMTEIKHINNKMDSFEESLSQLKTSVLNLEISRASKEGSMKVLMYLGMFAITTLAGFLTWTATSINQVSSEVQIIKNTLQAYDIEVIK